MNKTAKSILLGSLSLSLLAGCTSDDKKDSTVPPVPSEPKEVVFYGLEATGEYQMWVYDSDLTPVSVPDDKTLEFGNIKTSPVKSADLEPADFINISVSGNKYGSVRMNTANGLEYDLTEATTKGTLQFDLKVNSTDKNAAASVMIVGNSDKVPTGEEVVAEVDITSAISAYTGGETQQVRVPLSCFGDFDFSQTLTPFALNTEGNLDIDIDNIRFVPNSAGNRYDLKCEHPGTPLLRANSAHNMFTRGTNPDGPDQGFHGWARKYRKWEGGGTSRIHTEVMNKDSDRGRHLRVTFIDSEPAGRGGLLLDPNNNNMDWSQFVENGVLRFQLHVDDYALHPTHQLRVSFETQEHNSFNINLDPGCSNQSWGWVEVPIKELVTRADGAIDATIIQDVRNALHLAPADIRGQDTLQGLSYRLINVTLEPQPHPGSQIEEGYCQKAY